MTATISVRPISPTIGADVDAGDLRELDEDGRAQLRDAVLRHQVVFVRDQDLTADELLEVASWFGEPRNDGFELIGDGLDYVSTFEITPDRPPRADLWHTDVTYWASPASFALLYNVVAPAAGGDTLWSSSYAVYESLSPAIQRLCDGLVAEHAPGPGIETYVRANFGDDGVRQVAELFPPVEHPLVIRHPQTGRRALFMTSNFLQRIVGLHPREEEALLDLLRSAYDNPNVQVRCRWRPGSLAIWDERATNHRGLSDHWPSDPYRTMHTVFVGDGIRPSSLGVTVPGPGPGPVPVPVN